MESPIDNIYPYAYYNLAKYFYLTGDVVLVKDINKAVNYLSIASNNDIIEASILLLYIYVEEYLKELNDEMIPKIKELVITIERHPKYNEEIKEEIDSNLLKLKENKKINIDVIF